MIPAEASPRCFLIETSTPPPWQTWQGCVTWRVRLPCVTSASSTASSESDNGASSVAEEGGRRRLRLRLTCTRPAPAHLKHTTVLVVVVVAVVVAGIVVAVVDGAGGAELEAMMDGDGWEREVDQGNREKAVVTWPVRCACIKRKLEDRASTCVHPSFFAIATSKRLSSYSTSSTACRCRRHVYLCSNMLKARVLLDLTGWQSKKGVL